MEKDDELQCNQDICRCPSCSTAIHFVCVIVVLPNGVQNRITISVIVRRDVMQVDELMSTSNSISTGRYTCSDVPVSDRYIIRMVAFRPRGRSFRAAARAAVVRQS